MKPIANITAYTKPMFYIFLCIAFTTAGFIFFSQNEPAKYIVSPVIIGNIERQVTAIGEVASAQLVTVGSQASGQIKKLHVQIGQKVRKGDLIAEIDSTSQLNELNTNRATLETYKAQLTSRTVALLITQKQFARESKLKSKEATSNEHFENIENALAKAKADLAETQSLITKAQIAVGTAEANLGYTRIVAPIDGVIVSVPVEEGRTINASQVTPTIAQIAQLGHMKIKLQISEGDVTKIAPGMDVVFRILSDPKTEYIATLQSIDPAPIVVSNGIQEGKADSTENKAVYYYGRLLVENSSEKLRIGMTAQCAIRISAVHNALIVPNFAIQQEEQIKYVLVLKDGGEPIKRVITTGLSDSMNTEIRSGLQVGEAVVTAQMSEAEVQASVKKMQ